MATVGEVMSRRLLMVEAGTPVAEAARLMCDRGVGSALVGVGAGILTERDVLRAVASGRVDGTTVGDWMTRDPETVTPADGVHHAAAIMIHGGFRHLPVLDGGALVGMVSIRDLMRKAYDEDETPRGV